jgi:phosphinothricin acetyltransferase
MDIQLAKGIDLPAINCIYNQAVQERFATAHLEPVDMNFRKRWYDEHQHHRYPVFVARQRPGIRGWISLGPYREGRQALDHVAEVSYYVDRDWRKRGVGTALLKHIIGVSPSLGIEVLVAILLNRNPASIGLLEKFGFSRWGTMPGIARIGNESADHLYYGLKMP